MINTDNAGKLVISKNGKQNIVIDEYNRTTDGKHMITATALATGKKVYLVAANCKMEA